MTCPRCCCEACQCLEADPRSDEWREAGSLADKPSDGQQMVSMLEREGWVEYPNPYQVGARFFYKRFDTPTRCRCNDDKEGMQVCVTLWRYERPWKYEIELSGELSDGTWIKLHNWVMPNKLEDGLATIPRLLETWEFISANVEPPDTGSGETEGGES